jgi:hypothetical protein
MLEQRIDDETFLEFVTLTQSRSYMWRDFSAGVDDYGRAEAESSWWDFSVNPKLAFLFNDPSGFFKTSFRMFLNGSIRPWTGGLALARLQVPVWNDISTSNEPLEPDSTRTDIINYASRTTPHLVQYGFDQIFPLPGAITGHVGIGALEQAYMGLNGELFRYFAGGRFGAGINASLVWKRDLENDFQIKDSLSDYRYTYHLNLYGQPFGDSGVEVGARIGRFLGGDKGVRFELARTYQHFTFGVWYTLTDTSVFTSELNQGYRDKGVFFSFPFSIFEGYPGPRRLGFSFVPWTRDPGQMAGQFRSLYPLGTEQDSPFEIQKNVGEFAW